MFQFDLQILLGLSEHVAHAFTCLNNLILGLIRYGMITDSTVLQRLKSPDFRCTAVFSMCFKDKFR